MLVRLPLASVFLVGLTVAAAGDETPERLEVFPPRVQLKGPEASQTLVVLGRFADPVATPPTP